VKKKHEHTVTAPVHFEIRLIYISSSVGSDTNQDISPSIERPYSYSAILNRRGRFLKLLILSSFCNLILLIKTSDYKAVLLKAFVKGSAVTFFKKT